MAKSRELSAGTPVEAVGPGQPVYRWHLDSSHVRRRSAVFFWCFYSVFAQKQDQFTYRGKEDGLMISGVDMRLCHV